MAHRNRLTNNSDETDIASLISGDTIFSIPYFQRPYKWKLERLKQLNSDILALVDESSDFHFLGAVIVHGRRTNPSDPDIFEVIDGQQRITTLFLYICAAVKTIADAGEYQEAAALFLKYLVINRDTGAVSNFKLQSCKEDRYQLTMVYQDLMSSQRFKETLSGFVLRPMTQSGSPKGALLNNYNAANRFFKDELAQGGLDRVRAIYSYMLNRISVVQIDVWDPTNGPKIFDSLNSRQEPMTVGDLVRNDVFSRVANFDPTLIERIDAEKWQPFYKKFERESGNLFDGYFFPYGLVKNSNLKKSEAYSFLRKGWEGISDPAIVIDELSEFQDSYLDFLCGTNLCGHDKGVADAFLRFRSIRSPTSILPFYMQLSNSVKLESVDASTAISISELLQSFLVRRAVCGYEPTGLHSVFKRLWRDCDGEITADRVAREVAKHRTVPWPDDYEFSNAVRQRNLYKVGVTPYLVLEFDRSLCGDSPKDVPWLEHVLPQNPDVAWYQVFTKVEHEAMKDRLANLLPLSGEMNRGLSNKPYSVKQRRFREDSMFKSARQFAENINEWTPKTLEERAAMLAAWALARWPHQRPGGSVREGD